MITQQINISFTSAMAETIRIHTGESGRQIIFTPDFLEAIPDDHEADIIIVKPDNTFVIAAASIGSDGKIYVTIPEQAGAVSGVGNYILKVYDDENLCIYSACGGFYIDDHLLTDEMVESIAEVYGYRFPQDFAVINDDNTTVNSTWSSSKIAEEIAGVTPEPSSFIDDNEVLYDKTWSSEKISYELGNIQPFHVYTSTEQPVGRWIDGTMVYEMTIEASNISLTSAVDLTIPTDINIKEMSGIGRIFLSNRFYYMPIGCVSGATIGWNGIKIDASPKYGRVSVNLNAPTGSTQTYVQITIRYTKPLS